MTGNIALDVVIGLVFVYLLYSLYATILMELISSIFGLRARNLQYTLRRMLSDEVVYKGLQYWLVRIGMTFLRSTGYTPNLENLELYEKFRQQPSIKCLGSGGLGGRPSYISAESFSKALIDCVRDDDPDLSLMASLETGLSNHLKPDSQIRLHLESLMKNANNDPVKFIILLENWFHDTMDRSAGWFKQTTQTIVLLIGFVLTISFNVDSVAIIKKLSTDKDLRNQMLQLAMETDITENRLKLAEEGNKTDTTNQQEADSVYLAGLQRTRHILESELSAAQSVLQTSLIPKSIVFHRLKKQISPENNAVQDSAASDSIAKKIPLKDSSIDTARLHSVRRLVIQQDSLLLLLDDSSGYFVLDKSVNLRLIKKQIRQNHKDIQKLNEGETFSVDRFRYHLGYAFSGGRFWGYLLTMLALSLGAPFWFDLLNKLTRLRTGKPVTDVPAASGSVTNRTTAKEILNRVG